MQETVHTRTWQTTVLGPDPTHLRFLHFQQSKKNQRIRFHDTRILHEIQVSVSINKIWGNNCDCLYVAYIKTELKIIKGGIQDKNLHYLTLYRKGLLT